MSWRSLTLDKKAGTVPAKGATPAAPAPGGARPRMADVAARAGVSLSTVSYALSRRRPISEETRQRVLAAARALGFHSNSLGRNLAAKRSNLVAVVVGLQATTAYADPYFTDTLRGAATVAGANAYLLTLVPVPPEQRMAEVCLELWRQRRIDGCLLTAVASDDDSLSVLQAEGLPFVLLGSAPGLPNLLAVEVDNYDGAHRITQLLLDLGHRQLAHIAGPQQLAGEREVQRGFLAAMSGAAAPTPRIIEGDATMQGGYGAARELLRANRPTAIMCGNDLMATGAVQALQDAGVHVPQEVSVTGRDDAPVASILRPRLTTLRKPVAEIGAEAMRMLLDQMRGQLPRPLMRIHRLELIERESTGPVPER